MVLLTEVPWASRIWALPFLSALAYSERYTKDQPKGHRLTDRVGLAAARIGEALVLGARDGGRSRSCLRFSSCSSAADV